MQEQPLTVCSAASPVWAPTLFCPFSVLSFMSRYFRPPFWGYSVRFVPGWVNPHSFDFDVLVFLVWLWAPKMCSPQKICELTKYVPPKNMLAQSIQKICDLRSPPQKYVSSSPPQKISSGLFAELKKCVFLQIVCELRSSRFQLSPPLSPAVIQSIHEQWYNQTIYLQTIIQSIHEQWYNHIIYLQTIIQSIQ